MHRRAFLRGVAGSVGLTAVGTARPHPGPYDPLGSVSIENAREAVPDPSADFAYVATTDGFAVVDVKVPSDPRLVVEKRDLLADRETGPLRLIQDLKVEGDRLVVAGPADPLQGDVLQGFVLYDVSDPANPEQVAFHETEFPIHNCFLRDGIAYLTGFNVDGGANPLVMVDVSDDSPEEVGRWSLLARDERWAEVPPLVRSLHDVWVQDGRAYLAHWDAGTYLLDVSDPSNPAFLSCVGGRPLDELTAIGEGDVQSAVLGLPGNSHYAMANDDATLLGINKESWAVEGEGGPGGIELWDVSDARNPERLSTIDAPATADPSIGGTWTTSHNFDVVDGRFYSSWYQGGVKIHDVSDPANPEQLAWWRDPEATSFWTAKRATDRFFVASSMGRRSNGKGALYTFPNHAGQQKDPPSLTAAGNGTDGATTTPSLTTTEQAALAGGTSATGASDGSSSASTPGFGAPAALAALVGAGVGGWRTLRE